MPRMRSLVAPPVVLRREVGLGHWFPECFAQWLPAVPNAILEYISIADRVSHRLHVDVVISTSVAVKIVVLQYLW